MRKHAAYVRIDGEPFLARALAHLAEDIRVIAEWQAFAQQRGATAIASTLSALEFQNGGEPDGWTKPGPRSRWYSRPRHGHPDLAVMKAMPRRPLPREVFGNSLVYDLSYAGPDCRGSGGIGTLFGCPWIGRIGEAVYGLIPDAEAAVRDHLAAHPDHEITNGADDWRVPDGLTRVSEAEFNLAVAEAEVAAERTSQARAA